MVILNNLVFVWYEMQSGKGVSYHVSKNYHCELAIGCESHGSGSFSPVRKDPGFVLQYLWNEANNHITVFIMSYLGASDIIYRDVIDSFISEILKYKS